MKPEDILSEHSPEVQALGDALRILIQETVPDAIESPYPGWHGIGYTHPKSGYFCAIFPQKDAVKLGLEFGVLLPDPEGLLKGSGKQVRYVILDEGDEIPVQAIKALLLAVINLPESRQIKLDMINTSTKLL